MIAIEQEASERNKHHERQDHVEHSRATRHQVHAVEGQQEPGDDADEIRPSHPTGDTCGHQHGDGAQHRDGEPPPEGRDTEEELTAGYHPLAEGWVNDEGRVFLEDVDRSPIAIGRQDEIVGTVIELLLVAEAQKR